MLFSRIANFLSRRERRPFDAFQVEITTHCSLHCAFCPHESLRSSWLPRHMPMTLFDKLVPDLALARLVHLQGWGEPLLHPDLLRMVELAKGAGCMVGLTTNGVLLNEDRWDPLIQSGLDLLAVSIAGATPATHDALRAGSHLPEIVDNVSGLSRRKMALQSESPKIVVTYTMMRSNLKELPEAVRLAHKVGARELVAANLD